MRRLAGTLLVVLAGAQAAAQGGHSHTGHDSAPMTMQQMNIRDVAALKPLKGKAFDVLWTQRMIDHHQMAVNMAQYAYKNAADARVRRNAQQVMNVQQQEIDQMVGWLKSWKAAIPASQSAQMSVQGTSGSADHWFVTEMIPHHQGAVDMANLVPARTQNAQIRKLAQNILRTQTAEIKQYREWLKTLK